MQPARQEGRQARHTARGKAGGPKEARSECLKAMRGHGARSNRWQPHAAGFHVMFCACETAASDSRCAGVTPF